MSETTSFQAEADTLDQAREHATGSNARAITAPVHVTCECGRDLHITAHLDRQEIDAAVTRILKAKFGTRHVQGR